MNTWRPKLTLGVLLSYSTPDFLRQGPSLSSLVQANQLERKARDAPVSPSLALELQECVHVLKIFIWLLGIKPIPSPLKKKKEHFACHPKIPPWTKSLLTYTEVRYSLHFQGNTWILIIAMHFKLKHLLAWLLLPVLRVRLDEWACSQM